jgi:hypothetical protein
MNVDIFGSNGKSTSKAMDESKFITLVKNLATKIDKSYVDEAIENTRGEISSLIDLKVDKVAARIDGDLNMTEHVIYNVKDPSSPKDAVNKDYLDKIVTERGCSAESKVSKDGDMMLGDLDMHGNRVTRLEDPIHNLHAANKQYVDEAFGKARLNLYTLSSIGLIPQLWSNNDKSGYIVTTSNELDTNGFKAFNPIKGPWRVKSDGLSDFWIEIICLMPVKIYMFTIKPADGTKLIHWKIQAKNMMTDYVDLPFALTPIDIFRKYEINLVLAKEFYQYYRILVKEAESANNNPGLDHWQLFTINSVE